MLTSLTSFALLAHPHCRGRVTGSKMHKARSLTESQAIDEATIRRRSNRWRDRQGTSVPCLLIKFCHWTMVQAAQRSPQHRCIADLKSTSAKRQHLCQISSSRGSLLFRHQTIQSSPRLALLRGGPGRPAAMQLASQVAPQTCSLAGCSSPGLCATSQTSQHLRKGRNHGCPWALVQAGSDHWPPLCRPIRPVRAARRGSRHAQRATPPVHRFGHADVPVPGWPRP